MLHLALALIAAVSAPTTIAEPVTPAPYVATYAVNYRGLDAGLLHFELRADKPDRFVYESHAEPGLLASIIVSGNAVERSVMRIDASGVRPLSWFMDDGKPGQEDDGALAFAWDGERVSGTMEGERVELPTVPGLQDRLSFQIAVMTALLRAHEPGTIPMIDDGRIKQYSYTRAGTERLRTQAGEFETVLYESTRPGSNRVTRVWHAPALGYIPVRAEYLRKGMVETVMEVIRVERGEVRLQPLLLQKSS
ncbi:MAG TPA: DUF3108 domain-containing protein [Desulfuromonadales bacterium]